MKWHSESRVTCTPPWKRKSCNNSPVQAPCARLSAFLVPAGDLYQKQPKPHRRADSRAVGNLRYIKRLSAKFMAESLFVLPVPFTQNPRISQCKKCLLVKFRRWHAEKSSQIPAVRGFSTDAGKWAPALVTALVKSKSMEKAPKHRLFYRRWCRRFDFIFYISYFFKNYP